MPQNCWEQLDEQLDMESADPPTSSPPPISAGLTRRGFVAGTLLTGAAIALQARAKEPPVEREAAPPPPTSQPNHASVTLKINGKEYPLQLDPRVTLLDALRERTGLTGSKKGCDHGQCGACTVLIDGRRVNSCLTLALAAEEHDITTVEGLGTGDQLHPIQAAFIKHDAYQCGYCTPGQLCSAVGLLKEGQAKSDDDIRELMSGNICRCGAYVNIVAAVREVIDTTAKA